MSLATSDRPRIVHILNCFGADGANRGQLVTYADGTQRPFGCPSLIRAALNSLAATIGPDLEAALQVCDAPAPASSPTSRKRRRKASSSAQSAGGAE